MASNGTAPTAPAGGSPIRDLLVKEIKAAVAQIAPSLPPVQRMMLNTAAAAVVGMKEDMAQALGREVMKLADELRAEMVKFGIPNGKGAAS